MSRNLSGVYTLPAGSLVANGDISDASDLNTPLSDIETDLNTPRPVVAGGTGASTAADARTNLGLVIGTNVQAYDAGLTSIAGLTTAANKGIYTTASDTYATFDLTAAGRAILDDADAAAQLVTIGAQAADATLTSLSGLTLAAGDLLYATAADTLINLAKGTAFQSLKMNSGATAPEWVGIAQGGLTSTASGGPYLANIPAGVRKIEIMFDKISLDNNGMWFVQIGPSSGVVTTGYESASTNRGAGVGPSTNGFVLYSGATNRQTTGKMTLTLMDSATNLWIGEHSAGATNSDTGVCGGGRIALAGTLERFRLTFTAGNNPNGGQFRLQWE